LEVETVEAAAEVAAELVNFHCQASAVLEADTVEAAAEVAAEPAAAAAHAEVAPHEVADEVAVELPVVLQVLP
jgi:hypothetical protein